MLSKFQIEFLEEILKITKLTNADMRLLRSVREFSKTEKKEIREMVKFGLITKTPEEIVKWIDPKKKPRYDDYGIKDIEKIKVLLKNN